MKVSVLMPVYKTPLPWIQEAFESMTRQTYKEFELIMVDDRNMDAELVEYMYGPRDKCCLSVVRTRENKGLAAALDYGLKYCSGDIIIRMDSDDIAHPDLVKKHVKFFNEHQEAVICGVQIYLFSENGSRTSHHPHVVTAELARSMKGYWFVNHPGVAFKKEVVLSLGGYGSTPAHLAEDYALWIKILKAGHTIYNMPDVLVNYRVHPSALQKRRSDEWLSFLYHQKESLYV